MTFKMLSAVLSVTILCAVAIPSTGLAYIAKSRSDAFSARSALDPNTGAPDTDELLKCEDLHSCSEIDPPASDSFFTTSAFSVGDDQVTGEDSITAEATNTINLATGTITGFAAVSGSNGDRNDAGVEGAFVETLTFDLGGMDSATIPFSYDAEVEFSGEGICVANQCPSAHFRFAAAKGITSTPQAGGVANIFEERTITANTAGVRETTIEGSLTITKEHPVVSIWVQMDMTVQARHQGGFELVNPLPVVADATNTAVFDIDLPPGVSFSSTSGVFLTESGSPPEFACSGYDSPLVVDDPATEILEILTIGARSKRAIPVKTALEDREGFRITDLDLPSSDSGDVTRPVINVSFDSSLDGVGIADDSDLLSAGQANDGNIFRYDDDEQKWVFNLGTKDLSSAGKYMITMASGDSDAYLIDQESCRVSFERQ